MNVRFKDPETWRKIKPWMILVTYTLVLGVFLFYLGSITEGVGHFVTLFQSLLYGIVFAYILNLPMKKIEYIIMQHSKANGFLRKKKRPVAMLLTILLAIILIIILGSIVLPSIFESLEMLMRNLTSFFSDIVKNIDGILAYFHIDFKIKEITQVEQFIKMPWEKVVSNAINFLSGSASGILSSASSFLSSFFVGFTGFMFSLYLLSGKESFIRQIRKVIAAFFGYANAQVIFKYAKKVNLTFSKFISGQLVEACILWVLYYISMRLLGFPFPELISTVIAIFSLVPVFGAMFAMVLGAIMILSVDPMKSLWFMIFFQIMSQFEDNVIYPRVVGNSVGLPGLWVLLSIFVFGDLFGIFGMIMAVPTTACLYTFFSEFVHYLLAKKRLRVSEDTMERMNGTNT